MSKSGFFAVLRDDDDDDSSSSSTSDENQPSTTSRPSNQASIRSSTTHTTTTTPHQHASSDSTPSHEDLSSIRVDEETVLEAVYGEDFSKSEGVWGCPVLRVRVRPPDVEPRLIGSRLTLVVQLTKQYPYVVPQIDLHDVQGLSPDEARELRHLLRDRATELARTGSVMGIELVQVAEDYLLLHNQDPNLSAWEQMKVREAAQLRETQAQEDLIMARLVQRQGDDGPSVTSATRGSHSQSRVTFRDDSEVRTYNEDGEVGGVHPEHHKAAIERELLRQQEAFESARKVRTRSDVAASKHQASDGRMNEDHVNEQDDEDDEDVDYDMDENAAVAISGASRYNSDFIELGVLGRGGGGEVVKVRNRLDRRIYAVKKIILESEEGHFAQHGAIQNRKLLREVTTIAKMAHKNIVRYYQAWVEGGAKPEGRRTAEEQKESKPNQLSSSSSESGNDDADGSWWTNSPMDNDLPSQMKPRSAGGVSGSSFDDFDDDSESSEPLGTGSRFRNLHSESMVNLLEEENDHGFHDPLLAGLASQNRAIDHLYEAMPKVAETSTDYEDETWDQSSVKVGSASGRAILYIQMEYCATTLRKLIDDNDCVKMQQNELWRLVRQILEALTFLHRNLTIHRDLKPSNVFGSKAPFGEFEVKLGDFGLATVHRDKDEVKDFDVEKELDTLQDFYGVGEEESTSRFAGTFVSSGKASIHSTTGESMTGGVGTTFYIAPEQEGSKGGRKKGESLSYTSKADIFSFGIILFEIFHPPFSTYMERAETLVTLRADRDLGTTSAAPLKGWKDCDKEDLERFTRLRFPLEFTKTAPENAQRMILWCLERNPNKRPTAEELLSSELLPRKIELEQHYLDEALEILVTSSQSESYLQIVEAIFTRRNADMIEFTFDTDVAAKSNFMLSGDGAMELLRAMGAIRAGSIDMATLTSLAMSSTSIVAATASLRRSRNAGRLGKGGKGMLKRSTQRAAGILAMRAAAAAAVTGTLDGVHGADPLVVERVLDLCKKVFQLHGAVRLRSPLLRPRTSSTSTSAGGPAEVINSRGVVLLLPEDLTAPFARALGRGGSAASNLKRYDIGRVFHKSMADGHPREALEATFDVVLEDGSLGYLSEAETIVVVSQVMGLLPRRPLSIFEFETLAPLWFLRLSHTRLADALLDLFGVPPKDTTRRACLQILSTFTAPSPYSLRNHLAMKRKVLSRRTSSDAGSIPDLVARLENAVLEHGLPKQAAVKLRQFIECCMPLPADINDAIDALVKAIASIRREDSTDDARRTKRYEDAARSLRSLRDTVMVLQTLNLHPLIPSSAVLTPAATLSYPLYISLDLGLRQRRKNYHGGLLFQCIALPETYFDHLDPAESNDTLVLASGRGTKVAEGGNFSELVRKHRPPGSFGASFINYYATAPIPACTGVRFSIGKLVELIYGDATSNVQRLAGDGWNELMQKSTIDKPGLEVLRESLGHPLQYSETIQCVVSSVHGMDTASTKERFVVASRLWQEGISAEYLPQSGVMLSLLKRLREDSMEGSSDWSLTELVGVCALLNIPFLVIVQPHLLRDKGSVRLRRFPYDVIAPGAGSGGSGGSANEAFVSLDDLPGVILGDSLEDDADAQADTALTTTQSSSSRDVHRSTRDIQCIFIEHDSYYGNDRDVSRSENPHRKYLKWMKGISMSAQSYLSGLQDPNSPYGAAPVFAVAEAPFLVLRECGTALMRRERAERSAAGAAAEIGERYPEYKRPLKTLGIAIDNYMRRQGYWSYHTKSDLAATGTVGGSGASSSSHHHHHHQHHSGAPPTSSSLLASLLLYSKKDDRFDLLTLSCDGGGGGRHGAGGGTAASGKRGK